MMLNLYKGLTSLIRIKSFVTESLTLAQYGLGSLSINVSLSGYTPIGVAELFFNDTSVFTVSRYALNSARTVLNIDIVNNWNGSRSSKLTATVIYMKNA